MNALARRAGLCALASACGVTAAHGQPPAPTVVRVPNGPEVIVRTAAPGGSTNVISNSGNGFGNRIVVSGGGVTVVKNARNGIGNRLVLDADDLLIDLDELPIPKVCLPPVVVAPPVMDVKPVDPVYAGKANEFWTKKVFSDAYDCHLYWSRADRQWFRYHADDDRYRPVAVQRAAPADE